MDSIFHIIARDRWESVRQQREYRGDTLETEGFIHCSTVKQVVRVANARFHGRSDLLLLQIDPGRVVPEVRFEASDGEDYPHIYGPLNLDAVVDVIPFLADAEGTLHLPPKLQGGSVAV